MIGANDFCVDLCYHPQEHIKRSPEIHRRELMKVLDYLQDNLPRTLVNLVLPPSKFEFKKLNFICELTSA